MLAAEEARLSGATRGVEGAVEASGGAARVVVAPSSDVVLRGAAELDDVAFRALYDAHFDFVWRTFRRLGLQEADCYDASQEAFLTIRRKYTLFEARSTLRTWIFGICVGTARNKKRALLRANRGRASDSAIASAASQDASAEQAVSLRDARRLLEEIMGTMSPSLRASFVMFEIEQLSAEDIGEALGIPAATVRSRVRLAREHYDRAVKRLRATMKDVR